MPRGFEAIVPAAGSSTRMGTPKPLLDFDGDLCVDLVLRALLEGGCSRVIVVLGADSERIRPEIEGREGVHLVTNRNHQEGQTASVQAGLAALGGDLAGFLIHPVDHPLVREDDVMRMIQAFREPEGDAQGVVPLFHGRRGHPILLAGRHARGIMGMDRSRPLHEYVRPLLPGLLHLEMDNPGLVARMNTREEYAVLLELHRRSAGEGSR